MKVLFASSESYPFIKTGGLGDVTFALPKALRKLGVDVRVILPKYSTIGMEYLNKMEFIKNFTVKLGWREQYCGLFKLEEQGVIFYFIDNEYYFKRIRTYGDYDDGEKFVFFSKAILEAIRNFGDFVPDILHCNDWHTAMSIPLLKESYKDDYLYRNIKSVYTIHNLKYQGVFSKDILGDLLDLGLDYYSEDKLKYYDGISFMKGGIIFADMVSTVSPTYSQEIKTSCFGEGLHGLLSGVDYKLKGILNGIDMDLNNPQEDPNLFFNYNDMNLECKKYNKEELQRILNLPVNKDIPMIGMVTRLEEQKGIDLIQNVIEDILKQDVQFVVLGTGDRRYEDMFKFFAWKYPDKMSANIYFDSSVAQKIYASSDMFLMPSRFEPCGIGQLTALRYGSVPIVRETGGLNDTVRAYNEFTGEGNGFTFKEFNAYDMLYTINRALGFYRNKEVWDDLIRRGMKEDNSWNKSGQEYIDMYNMILQN